jgi:hypothetical protein
MLRLIRREALEHECKRAIEDRLRQAQLLLSQMNANKQAASPDNVESAPSVPPLVNESFFKGVDELLVNIPLLNRMWKVIKALDAKANKLNESYTNQKKQYKQRTKKEIGICLQNLLSSKTNRFKTYLVDHPIVSLDCNLEQLFLDFLEGDEQRDFITLVADIRNEEGRNISTFMNQIETYTLAKVPDTEILRYIESYATFLSQIHNVTDPFHVKCLHLFVNRMIFSLVGPDLISLEVQQVQEMEEEFLTKVRLLKDLSPAQLGVDMKFLPLSDSANCFRQAIDILEYLLFCVSSQDMLHCIYCCAKSIHNTAHSNCTQRGQEFSFGADEFFPIFVYVVVQSNLFSIHAHLSFLKKFSPTYCNPESMYFCTCLEGAVCYITQLTPEDITNLTKVEHPTNKEKVIINMPPILESCIETPLSIPFDVNDNRESCSVTSTQDMSTRRRTVSADIIRKSNFFESNEDETVVIVAKSPPIQDILRQMKEHEDRMKNGITEEEVHPLMNDSSQE